MKNKFGAQCSICGLSVAPGVGDTNKVGERWITKHIECPTARTKQPAQPRVNHSFYLDLAHGDQDCFDMYGMTNADFRDAVNPDEGDK